MAKDRRVGYFRIAGIAQPVIRIVDCHAMVREGMGLLGCDRR
jgi:hypothetical protein